MKTLTKKSIALLTGAIVALSTMTSAQVRADEKKEKQLKTGAAILGAIGAYFAVKGKTVPAVIAGAGAYYAYKKGKEARDEYSYRDDEQHDERDRYSERSSRRADNQHRDDDLGYDASYDASSDTNYRNRDESGYGEEYSERARDDSRRDVDFNADYHDNDLGYDALAHEATQTGTVEKLSREKTVVID